MHWGEGQWNADPADSTRIFADDREFSARVGGVAVEQVKVPRSARDDGGGAGQWEGRRAREGALGTTEGGGGGDTALSPRYSGPQYPGARVGVRGECLTMADYTFADVHDEHWPALCVIYNHYVEHSTATFHNRPFAVEAFRALLTFSNPRHRTFVALVEGEVCGYCVVAPHKNREAYDDTAEVSVYVRPDRQRHGIGAAAVDHMEEYARRVGLHALIATICGDNAPSIALFAGKGYQQCAHFCEVGTKFGRRLDVVCYQKLLTQEQE